MLEIDKYHLCCFTIKFTCKSALRNPGRLLSVSDDTLKKKKKTQVSNVKFAFRINKFESKSRHTYFIAVLYLPPLILCFPNKQKVAKGQRFNAVSGMCCKDS